MAPSSPKKTSSTPSKEENVQAQTIVLAQNIKVCVDDSGEKKKHHLLRAGTEVEVRDTIDPGDVVKHPHIPASWLEEQPLLNRDHQKNREGLARMREFNKKIRRANETAQAQARKVEETLGKQPGPRLSIPEV